MGVCVPEEEGGAGADFLSYILVLEELSRADAGVGVTVALREGSLSAKKATNAGLQVKNVAEAVAAADLIMILTPDEFQSRLYKDEIEPNLKKGATLASPMALPSITTRSCRAPISTSS